MDATKKKLADRLAQHTLNPSDAGAVIQLSHDARSLASLVLRDEEPEDLDAPGLACAITLLHASVIRSAERRGEDPDADALVLCLGSALAIVTERKKTSAIFRAQEVLERAQ
jgi:hypothetical protein